MWAIEVTSDLCEQGDMYDGPMGFTSVEIPFGEIYPTASGFSPNSHRGGDFPAGN